MIYISIYLIGLIISLIICGSIYDMGELLILSVFWPFVITYITFFKLGEFIKNKLER